MAPTGEQNPGGNPDTGAERKLGQGDRVILKGLIVNERNGVARVQVCRQLVYCMTDELEEDTAEGGDGRGFSDGLSDCASGESERDAAPTKTEEEGKAISSPPLTRAVSGPGATKGKG